MKPIKFFKPGDLMTGPAFSSSNSGKGYDIKQQRNSYLEQAVKEEEKLRTQQTPTYEQNRDYLSLTQPRFNNEQMKHIPPSSRLIYQSSFSQYSLN